MESLGMLSTIHHLFHALKSLTNAGGHTSTSAIQNPAWDFEWIIEDYPLDKPVGFDGRLIYSAFQDEDQIMLRYQEWDTRKLK